MAWDAAKPANLSAIVSAEMRANFAAIAAAIGNPDTTPLAIKQATIAALSTFGDAPTYKPGAAATFAATVNGLLSGSVDTTQRANSGAGETTLSSYALPANVLNANGKAVRVVFWGTLANNANAKALKVKFGATVFTVGALTFANVAWRAELIIFRTGAATQKAVATMGYGNQNPSADAKAVLIGAPTETLSGAVTITTTGQGVATNDVVQEGFYVEVIG